MKVLLVITLLCTLSNAQDKFFTTERKAVTFGIAAESVYDGYASQVMLYKGYYEGNPLARPLVNRGAAGQVAASALGVAAVLGVQYLVHRTHHERAVNWIGRIALVGEGANCVRQSQLIK